MGARTVGPMCELANRYPDRGLAVKLDVTDPDQRASAVQSCRDRFGSLDVLVNSAGTDFWGAIEEQDEADYRATFEVNLFGAVELIRLVLPDMYYSCCFSVCDRAAAQRGSWVGRDGYVVSPPSGGRWRGEAVSAGERGLDGGGPQLGQGGQRGVAADRLVGPGLALVPAEGVLSRLERNFDWPSAACDGDEIGDGRGPAVRCPAQVERVLVLVPVREAADQQELPRVRSPDERPVAVTGSFRPVPPGPSLDPAPGYSVVSPESRALAVGTPGLPPSF